MGVSSTILYGNCIEKNQPVSGTGHHKVVLKGKYKGQKSSFMDRLQLTGQIF